MATIYLVRDKGEETPVICIGIYRSFAIADRILQHLLAHRLGQRYALLAPEFILGTRVKRPKCQHCRKELATLLAAASTDKGKHVRWKRICAGCSEGWSKFADWTAPIYPIGEGVYRVAEMDAKDQIKIPTRL